MTVKKPELLAPAGDLEKLKTAVLYGADAVYIGGQRYGLRAYAGNFSEEDMVRGIKFAHERGVRVYVTVNIFPHNEDLAGLAEYLQLIRDMGADGIIAADPGIIATAGEVVPDLPIHLSTQANTTNWRSARFWESQGIARIVLARELSFREIEEIRKKINIELEVFIHGAMCISYSGRCLLSSYMTGRDANRGECAQPCRWRYALVEEKRPGLYFPIEEDERGAYIFNSRDMCMIEYIPELCSLGAASFKIEGRMKSVHYVATVVKAYRQAIDEYYRDPAQYKFNKEWLEEINKVSNREYTTGFYFGKPTERENDKSVRDISSQYRREYDFIGLVKSYDEKSGTAVIEQRNKFVVGDIVEFMSPKLNNFQLKIKEMFNEEGETIKEAPHPQQIVKIKIGRPLEEFSIMRREKGEGIGPLYN